MRLKHFIIIYYLNRQTRMILVCSIKGGSKMTREITILKTGNEIFIYAKAIILILMSEKQSTEISWIAEYFMLCDFVIDKEKYKSMTSAISTNLSKSGIFESVKKDKNLVEWKLPITEDSLSDEKIEKYVDHLQKYFFTDKDIKSINMSIKLKTNCLAMDMALRLALCGEFEKLFKRRCNPEEFKRISEEILTRTY